MKLNLDLYKTMYLIRRCEEKIIELYPNDDMKTPMHMSMGEEAIVAGVVHALNPEDQVFGTYRSHALFLAKTKDTDEFFAELYGKNTSLLKGKGGSMHLCHPDKGFMGSSGIVASHIPVAVGASWANKIKKNGKIVVVFFGDGATNEGVFWESLNVACLMQLPIIFVCEDNDLAVHSFKKDRNGYACISDIVKQFDCDSRRYLGNSVSDIYELTKLSIDQMRNDCQYPVFLQFNYHRHLEHVGINEDYEAGYRSERNVKDPVQKQRDIIMKLVSKNISSTNYLNVIERLINNNIEQSIQKAQQAPFCNKEELYKDG